MAARQGHMASRWEAGPPKARAAKKRSRMTRRMTRRRREGAEEEGRSWEAERMTREEEGGEDGSRRPRTPGNGVAHHGKGGEISPPPCRLPPWGPPLPTIKRPGHRAPPSRGRGPHLAHLQAWDHGWRADPGKPPPSRVGVVLPQLIPPLQGHVLPFLEDVLPPMRLITEVLVEGEDLPGQKHGVHRAPREVQRPHQHPISGRSHLLPVPLRPGEPPHGPLCFLPPMEPGRAPLPEGQPFPPGRVPTPLAVLKARPPVGVCSPLQGLQLAYITHLEQRKFTDRSQLTTIATQN